MTRPIVTLTLLIVSAFFLLGTCVQGPAESAAEFEQRITPEEVVEEEPELDARQEMLEARLQQIGEGFAGEVGIAAVEVASGATMAYNGDRPFPQQSVSKLWVSLTALDLVDEGALDLSEPVAIRREDLTVFYQPIRDIVRTRGVFRTDYRDLMERALTQSDNTANDRLLRRVGGTQAVEAFMRRKGIEGVQFGTDERSKQSAIAGLDWRPSYSIGRNFYEARDRVPDDRRREAFEDYLDDPIDGASASGMAQALARLARGELLSPRSTEFILSTLENTKSGPKRLKGGVPSGWSIAHKTGTGQVFDGDQSGYNDVGVLTAPDGTQYALAVLIARTRTSYAARFEMMQSVTRSVVEYHEARMASETT